MLSGLVHHYWPGLLVLCGASLYSVTLMWCLIISHDFWCGVTLSAVTVGVVLHYRTRLPVWCRIIPLPRMLYLEHCIIYTRSLIRAFVGRLNIL